MSIEIIRVANGFLAMPIRSAANRYAINEPETYCFRTLDELYEWIRQFFGYGAQAQKGDIKNAYSVEC